MKLKLFSILLILFSATVVLAQDDSGWISKTYDVGDFSTITLSGAFKVHLVQGNDCSVTVKTTNSEAFNNLKVRQHSNEVEIKMDKSFFKLNRISLYITFKSLETLKIEGGANLKTNGFLDLNNFTVGIEGGANIELALKVNNLKVYGEGGFLFEMQGVANSLDVTIKGAGNVNASELKAKDVSFTVEGFGTGSVHAINTLNARIEGVGRLRYRGDPKVNQYIDGLGSVKPEF